MSFRATHRNARIAPRKARLVADMIRGMNAAEALVALEFSPQRAAWYYKSVLKSAMANAEEQDADSSRLEVFEIRAVSTAGKLYARDAQARKTTERYVP